MDIEKWIKYVGTASATTLMAGALVLWQMGYIVSGQTLADMKSDRDAWKELALRGANMGPRLIGALPSKPLDKTATLSDVRQALEKVEE